MRIGIIVFSRTGNTFEVARRLEEGLKLRGHEASLKRIELEGNPQPGDQNFTLKVIPDPLPYEALIFGAAVEAFSLSPVMKRYLTDIPELAGKPAACFVTEFFPYAWMGGNNAIRQMKKLCVMKGAKIAGSGVINWKNPARREEQIERIVERFAGLF
jgi:flavodoxin